MDYGVKAIGQKISRAYQWKQIFEKDKIKFKVDDNSTIPDGNN